MPVKICEVCKRPTNVSSPDWKYIDPVGPYVCSADCAFKWIKQATMEGTVLKKAVFLHLDRANWEWSPYMRMWFRSNYEKRVAEESRRRGFSVRYEELGFVLSNGNTYTPDFLLRGHCFVEVKGLWGVGAKLKLKKFREEYPDIPLLVMPWTIQGDFD